VTGERFRVKANDFAGRWRAGEIGEELANDMPEKYAHKLDFGIVPIPEGTELFGKPLRRWRRVFYFYADEVERLPPEVDQQDAIA
jgi:hypothetical protein